MPRNLTERAADNLTRVQLTMFQMLGDQINLTQNDRGRTLRLTDREWLAWVDFLADGPRPADPALPEMLRRLGETAFNLSVMAERRSVVGRDA